MNNLNSPSSVDQGAGIPVNAPGSLSPAGVAVNTNSTMSSNNNPDRRKLVNNYNNNSPGLTQAQLQLLQQQQLQKMQSFTPQQQQQQKQRMLLQQRAIQQQRQQQAMQNYENQFYQLLMTLNKKPKRLYNFVEDSDSILKKYEQYRPSFEFHIYENNYKICAPANTRVQQQQKSPEVSNDGLVLNKNNETLKEFLEYVARGIIPEAIMEVLRDCNIQFYEGNLVLQVYDHTNTVDVIPKDLTKASSPEEHRAMSVEETPGSTSTSIDTTQTEIKEEDKKQVKNENLGSQDQDQVNFKKEPKNDESGNKTDTATSTKASFRRPRVYRTLLRPNDLTNYYDMMTYADQARFSDSIYQQLESEILTLTKRNINLDVGLNPYEHRDKLDEQDFSIPTWSDDESRLKFNHRPLSKQENTKGAVGHIKEHEELPQHNSTYEQMMLIMSERTSTTTSSAFAAALAKHANEVQMSKNGSSGSGSSKNLSNSGRSNGGSSTAEANQVSIAAAASSVSNENNQFSRLKFIEQYRINKEKRKQQQALNMANGNSNFSGAESPFNMKISMTMPSSEQNLSPQQQQLQQLQKRQATQGKGSNKRFNNSDKPKVKRPRKTKKTSANGDAPKKRRVTKKKGSTTASTPNITDNGSVTGTPASFISTGSPEM